MVRVQRDNKKKNDKMGKRVLMGLTSLAMAFVLTGCSNVIPIMNEEEEQAVSEYAALLLLKYDANNRSRLVDLSLIKEEPKETPEEKDEPEIEEEQGMGPVADTPVVELPQGSTSTSEGTVGSMEAFFQLPEGMSLTFQGTEVSASYLPDGESNRYFAMDASAGKSLLVLKYMLSNQSGAEQTVDLLGQNAIIRATVNGDHTQFVQMTMLTNDLSTYSGTIGAGESQELVLIVEIDQSVADNLSSISLNLKNEANVYTTSLM